MTREERRAIAKRAVQKFAAERAPEIRAVLDTEQIIERARKRPLKLFNGRWNNCKQHAYVAAYSISDVIALCAEVGVRITRNEIDIYWSKGQWGIHMEGIEPERGIWVQDWMSRPKRFNGRKRRVGK